MLKMMKKEKPLVMTMKAVTVERVIVKTVIVKTVMVETMTAKMVTMKEVTVKTMEAEIAVMIRVKSLVIEKMRKIGRAHV